MPDHSVLGESWVVASTASLQNKDQDRLEPADSNKGPPTAQTNSNNVEAPETPTPQSRSARNKDSGKTTESISSLTSSSYSTISGPELIMPSIYDVPISEASWVAPAVRSKDQTMRKRRKISTSRGKQQPSPTTREKDAASLMKAPYKARISLIERLKTLYHEQTHIRFILNTFLVGSILHLLVLPEIIYQSQDLCQFPAVKAIYPDSCVRLTTRPPPQPYIPSSNPIISPEETISTSQKGLESIFDTSLRTLSPLSQSLKESESMLHALQEKLRSIFPDVRHALDLEFQGSDQAIRAAAWEFDSLRADLRSAVESLLSSPPTQETTGPASIARDTRIAAQLRRRAEYLDRLRGQIRSKADELITRFSVLDDHLEAVQGIVTREQRKKSLLAFQSPGGKIGEEGTAAVNAMLRTISSYASFGSRLLSRSTIDQPPEETPSDLPDDDSALQLAATHHRPVADSVTLLSRQLRDLQRARQGPT